MAKIEASKAEALAGEAQFYAANFWATKLLKNFSKIEVSKRDYGKDDLFLECFDKASIIVANNNCEVDTRKNCIFSLAHAAQKKFKFSKKICSLKTKKKYYHNLNIIYNDFFQFCKFNYFQPQATNKLKPSIKRTSVLEFFHILVDV